MECKLHQFSSNCLDAAAKILWRQDEDLRLAWAKADRQDKTSDEKVDSCYGHVLIIAGDSTLPAEELHHATARLEVDDECYTWKVASLLININAKKTKAVIEKTDKMSLNLEKQLLFYGAYHHNTVNVVIHIICVPLLLLTGLLLGTNTPEIIPTPSFMLENSLPLNLGVIFAFLYAVLFILLEPVAGGMLAPLIVGGTAYSNYLTKTYGAEANYWAGGVHIVCWLAQFVGHGVYEGRAPALLDNLVQALFLAPLFVWLEVLFKLGYRPELQARLEAGVTKEIAKYRNSKGQAGKATNGKAH